MSDNKVLQKTERTVCGKSVNHGAMMTTTDSQSKSNQSETPKASDKSGSSETTQPSNAEKD